MNEHVFDAVESAKDKMKHARALIQGALSELRTHGEVKLAPDDPYSQDLEDVRDVLFAADGSMDVAISALDGLKIKEVE